MVVVASGRIDPDSFIQQVDALMGGLTTATPLQPSAAAYQGLRLAERRAVEQAHWILGYQGVSAHDDAHYAFVVLATLLGGGMSSRLFQEVREKQGLAYSVEAFHTAYADAGVFGIHAGTDPHDLERLQTTVHQVIDACHADYCTAGTPELKRELARAKAQLKSGTLMGMEGLSARAERFAQHVLRWNRLLPLAETLQRIDDVTAHDLVRCIDRMRAHPKTLAMLGPVTMDLSDVDALMAIR
jgi:predicted Zn-dependent peptidase